MRSFGPKLFGTTFCNSTEAIIILHNSTADNGPLVIYNECCLSFDGIKWCVTTGFWLIIMSSDIINAPKSGLPNGKASVLTVLDILNLKTIEKSFKRATFSPSFKAKRLSASGGFAPTPWPGALPLNTTGAPPPDPRYRLTLAIRPPLSLIPGYAPANTLFIEICITLLIFFGAFLEKLSLTLFINLYRLTNIFMLHYLGGCGQLSICFYYVKWHNVHFSSRYIDMTP